MSHRIDLLLLGGDGAPPDDWSHGECLRVEPNPNALAGALANSENGEEDDLILLWEADRKLPSIETLSTLASGPMDLWHGGLRRGTAGLPGLIDFTRPSWPHNRDPDGADSATSWRLHPGCCLVRKRVLQALGGPDPGFATLLASALEMGHRFLRGGALLRYEPSLAPAEGSEPGPLPPGDEVRFVRLRFGRRWACWALCRAVLSGRWTLSEARTAWAESGEVCQGPRRILPPVRRHTHAHSGSPAEEHSRVTVLIPTLDRYEHLARLLEQLPRQTVKPHEVIVVDQTPEQRRRRLDTYLPLRWMVREERGQCSSRNAGLQHASGRFVLFLDDDDDELPDDLIAAHLRNLDDFGADVSCGVVEEVGAGPPPEAFRHFRIADVLPTNNCLVRRSALVTSGLFDLAYEHGARADADLGMRLYLSGALAVLDPEISLLHRRAPVGGLRTWGARRRTYAASRASLWQRHLPSRTEMYLTLRYFSDVQVRERMWIAAVGTLSVHGSAARRLLRALIGLVTMPHTLWTLRRRRREAARMLEDFPRIPRLERER